VATTIGYFLNVDKNLVVCDVVLRSPVTMFTPVTTDILQLHELSSVLEIIEHSEPRNLRKMFLNLSVDDMRAVFSGFVAHLSLKQRHSEWIKQKNGKNEPEIQSVQFDQEWRRDIRILRVFQSERHFATLAPLNKFVILHCCEKSTQCEGCLLCVSARVKLCD